MYDAFAMAWWGMDPRAYFHQNTVQSSLAFEPYPYIMLPQAQPAITQADTQKRNTLFGTAEQDTFVLSNDGKVDTINRFEDGVDQIDLTAIDATFDQLMIKQINLQTYVIDYQGEERTHLTFNRPETEDIPPSGFLLTEDDFIFRDGVPDATTQVIFENSSSSAETIVGTTSPDVFVLNDDDEKDVIRKFETGKDMIDLADYGVSFGDLRIREEKEGRIVINIPGGGEHDKIILIDVSRQLTEEDITAELFIF